MRSIIANQGAPVITDVTLPADISLAANPAGLQVGDVIIISDCEKADVVQITALNVVAGSTLLTPNGGTNAYEAARAQVFPLTATTFFIQQDSAGRNGLYRSLAGGAAQEMIQGVERMQMLYGIDSDADGSANRYLPADIVPNMDQVVGVRLSLLVRTLSDGVALNQQTYSFNGGSATAPDRRNYLVVTSTIMLRNRLRT